jgi:ribonuclease PH
MDASGYADGHIPMTGESTQRRRSNELRPIKIRRRFTRAVAGSVLYQAGRTTVLCTASVSDQVPAWMAGQGRGWITAEYNMLPGSTVPRKSREREGRLDGRTTEIQRLIGRSLRAVADLEALGERVITVDCDVLEADGGTRTASITGGFLALVDALRAIQRELPDPRRPPLRDCVAAVSVGLVDGTPTLDLDYPQDAAASVDMNVVMTGAGRFVEVQGTGEEATFSETELQQLLQLARRGIQQLTDAQRSALGKHWPFA